MSASAAAFTSRHRPGRQPSTTLEGDGACPRDGPPGAIALMSPIGGFVTVNVRTDANLPGSRRADIAPGQIRIGPR
jgi:hypothetical protein